MPSRGESVRYLTILLAAVPAVAYGYRRPSPAWLLVIIIGSLPILVYHVVVFGGRAKKPSPHVWRNRILVVACVLAVPIAAFIGDQINDLDFRYRRMALYERLVEQIERGEIAVDRVNLDDAPYLRGEAISIGARRTKEAGLIVRFGWATAGYAGGSAYVHCRGAACEKMPPWRHYSRINERWLRATDH
jgi:hypothetical protein